VGCGRRRERGPGTAQGRVDQRAQGELRGDVGRIGVLRPQGGRGWGAVGTAPAQWGGAH